MYPSNNYKKKVTTILIGFTLLLTVSACTPSKIQNRIDQTDEINQKAEKNVKPEDMNPEDIELSKEQQDVLDNIDDSVESALEENELEEVGEVDKKIPPAKESFDTPEELSQYFAELMFIYNKMEIDSDLYHSKVSPYFHEKFLEYLPESDAAQKETFKLLQQTFHDNLPSEIVDYRITEVIYSPRQEEASVFRVYELKNNEELYFVTRMESVNDKWLITDDRPSPPYKIKAYEK